MSWRERLSRLASFAAETANTRRVRVAGQVLLAGGLVFVLIRLRSIWGEGDINLESVRWPLLAGAAVVALSAIVASGFVWLAILECLGVATRRAWAGIFLQAQVAKYVPGSLWQYAGRAALARTLGIPMGPFTRSLPVELAASASAAAIFSILLVGWWGAAIVVALFGLVALADVLAPTRLVWRATLRGTLFYGAVWLLVSLSFCLTAAAFISVPAADLPIYAGAFAVAWIVGLVAVYAPGGIGVREAVLVALLRGKIGSADALVVAAASRGVLTSADLLGAAVGRVILRGARRSTDAAGAPPAP
jgi:uncharacterized membrane protein YbhN (UPF0104 family)